NRRGARDAEERLQGKVSASFAPLRFHLDYLGDETDRQFFARGKNVLVTTKPPGVNRRAARDAEKRQGKISHCNSPNCSQAAEELGSETRRDLSLRIGN